ncbi:tyrosine-type recombinase/integrase [Nakamurella lactea]|uniref:tyrosine-type recombinase/integrase n=1 Tax=Nakamurella lactea TaxID=459515 RepID=UPI001FE0B814|nr:site-specific integrase [Nakamurella lactea]
MADAPPRVALMLRLAAEAGLRRAEVAVIQSDDLIEDLYGWSLVVHGKGDRDRVVPLPASLAAELRSHEPGFLFPGNEAGHLSPRWVGKLCTRYLPDHWTMHSLRHRFASRAYAVDRDVFTVQDLLGHVSPVTTRMYVVPPADAKRRLSRRFRSRPVQLACDQ